MKAKYNINNLKDANARGTFRAKEANILGHMYSVARKPEF